MDLTQDIAFTLTQYSAYTLTQDSAFTGEDGRNRGGGDNKQYKRRKRRRDRVYEQLGTPCLLYRNNAVLSSSDNNNAAALAQVAEDDFCTGPRPPWAALGTRPRFGHMDPALLTQLIHGSTQRLNRTQARWYYPMDFSILKSTFVSEEWGMQPENPGRKKKKRGRPAKPEEERDSAQEQWAKIQEAVRETKEKNKTKRPELHSKLIPLKVGDPFGKYDSSKQIKDKQLLDSRGYDCIEEARFYMLETSFVEDDNELEHLRLDQGLKRRPHTVEQLQKQHHADILRGFKKYDHPYVPARWKVYWYSGEPVMHLPNKRIKAGLHFSQQRRNRADPAQMAPFPCESIYETLEADKTQAWEFGKTTPIPSDDPNHPSKYGNCIRSFICFCPPCTASIEAGDQPTWCLLHPTGKLLEKVTVSTLCTPQGSGNAALPRLRRNMDTYQKRMGAKMNELDIGDTILQLAQCGGKETFLARTAIHVTVFAVVAQRETYTNSSGRAQQPRRTGSTDSDSELCWGVFRVTELQRIDLRSFAKRGGPSYCPLDMTAHPLFGNTVWNHKHKFAILSYSNSNDNNQERNVIHHFLWSMEEKTTQVWSAKGKKELKANAVPEFHVTKHTIGNLKAISEIAFSPAHPMVSWAVAKSYVRPALVPDFSTRTFRNQPRLGHGCALFSIDLRTNQATFQWSPSSEELLSEGIHSISGIAPEWHDPNKKNTVWVSSVSAGKMWEIDGSLPCRVINMWSLPSQCDDCGATLPAVGGLYGAGTILAWPSEAKRRNSTTDAPSDLPVLSVGKAPDTYGLHLYQKPKNPPRFQTQGIECAASSALHNWAGKKSSIKMSSVFALPDVSDKVFTCGLAPIRLPLTGFLTKSTIADLACNIERTASMICVITMTNRGDLYTHALLEVRPDKNQQFRGPIAADGLPVGSACVPVPPREAVTDGIKPEIEDDENLGDDFTVPRSPEKKLAGGMNLHLQLSNESPISRERATAAVTFNSQTLVRPFRYSNLRQMPIQGEPTGTGSDLINKEVQSKGHVNDVAVRTGHTPGEFQGNDSVVLPENRNDPQKQQLISALQCFHDSGHQGDISGAKNNDEQMPRSDLTSEILEFADGDWK